MDSLSWESESPLWDLIDGNNPIPRYEDIALINAAGNTVNPKVENNRFTHKGKFFIDLYKYFKQIILNNFNVTDSPVSDRFISPAPGQTYMKMSKQITINENKQYFSATSRNNIISLPTVIGPIKKIGTIGLFFRKVRKYNIHSIQFRQI